MMALALLAIAAAVLVMMEMVKAIRVNGNEEMA